MRNPFLAAAIGVNVLTAGCAATYCCAEPDQKVFGTDIKTARERVTLIDASAFPGYPYASFLLKEEFSKNCPSLMSTKLGCYASNVYHLDKATGEYSINESPSWFMEESGVLSSLDYYCKEDKFHSSFAAIAADKNDQPVRNRAGYEVIAPFHKGPLLQELVEEYCPD